MNDGNFFSSPALQSWVDDAVTQAQAAAAGFPEAAFRRTFMHHPA